MKPEYLKLFDFLMEIMLQECGDGDAWVYCKYTDVDDMAAAFEKYLAENIRPHNLSRYPSRKEGEYLFSDGCNENVVFTKHLDDPCPTWVSVKVVL
jgi:hypothetical protein